MLNRELNQLLLTLGFFTRLPMRSDLQYSPEIMHAATKYFPIVGWLLAGLLGATYQMGEYLFGAPVSLVVLMCASILLTGALHEDGLADTFDGFYGGQSQEHKLDIMKDSRLGAYGTCALIAMLLLKLTVLWALATADLFIIAICLAYPLSRALALSFVQDLQYVSHLGTIQKNKSDSLAKPVSTAHMIFVLISGGIASIWLPLLWTFTIGLCCFASRKLIKHWQQKHINGFTGDTLGASQQLFEATIYLSLLACSRLAL